MSTLETLEICFRANLDGVDGQLEKLAGRLGAVDSAAMASAKAMEAAGREMVQSVGRGLAEAVGRGGAQQTGRLLVQEFESGLRDGGAQVKSAAAGIALSARFDGGSAAAVSAGRALSDGFAKGIRGGSGAVNAAVKAMVAQATGRIRSMLQIHSPSKVAEGYGSFFGEGFAGGILGAADGVERAALSLGRAAGTGLASVQPPAAVTAGSGASLEGMVKAAVDGALGGVQLTVPLYVDGMKLGEASIRGINAVTRSAGRVMLNL